MLQEMWNWYQPNSEKLMTLLSTFQQVWIFYKSWRHVTICEMKILVRKEGEEAWSFTSSIRNWKTFGVRLEQRNMSEIPNLAAVACSNTELPAKCHILSAFAFKALAMAWIYVWYLDEWMYSPSSTYRWLNNWDVICTFTCYPVLRHHRLLPPRGKSCVLGNQVSMENKILENLGLSIKGGTSLDARLGSALAIFVELFLARSSKFNIQ